MISFEITAVGGATGVILPDEVLQRLKVRQGDRLYLTETPDGGYRISARDPDGDRQIALAAAIMREDEEILHTLAK